ncbi:ATP-binding protein [Limimaricola pyoseonensis]|uniref:Rad50/SbcC-type AAA domain-containing protein n=1 Tax=Limimaricola pyoseonensis TaxID=521013 RepID=A0A1G7LF25_9RHOB|nr:ATP-binding protein [Limimaricola pyoseonensis]SDF48065.1 hypothetical protein SAMN04488567_0462 [Limimaricola pyoseonensis]
MTPFNPRLIVRRLKIMKSGQAVFDEYFHSGLNIIRGENSSGKSTIMDFLYYSLGGDVEKGHWREAAANCDSVIAEISVNGRLVTLMREIEETPFQPMRVFYGTIDEADAAPLGAWETYPFKRGKKESFSQVLFRFLGLPEIEYGEESARLTMNQVLRLLYADQMSSVERIFRPVSFDLAITRQAVGDLLCGGYSDTYYKSLLRRRSVIASLQDVRSSIQFLIKSHKRDGRPITKEWIGEEGARIEKEISDVNSKIESIEKEIFDTEFTDRLSLNDQKSAYSRVVELQKKIGSVEEKITRLNLQIADTDSYIVSIEHKLEQLDQANTVVESMGGLAFEFCPSCFAPVEDHSVDGGCNLCKSTHSSEETKRRVLKLVNEYSRQRKRAQSVQEDRRAELRANKATIEELKSLWKNAGSQYEISLRTPTSEMRSRLRELNRQAGYLYREQEELAFFGSVVEELNSLSKQREDFETELAVLDDVIEGEKIKQTRRLREARIGIEAMVLDFLHRDLSRQITFELAEHVSFEFDADRLSVNGESFFSASSMVYLRNSFFASFLFAAANDPDFLHPRFLIMDTVEDKGMEPERSMNFQRLLRDKSANAVSSHQIIIATSMIAPELDNPDYTVGKFYTHERKTLALQK